MPVKIIKTNKAPAPIGPYNQATEAAGLVFISGQICIDPATGEMDNQSISAEANRVMSNLKAILDEAGLGFDNVAKTTIFLSDMSLFAEVNEIYGSYFSSTYPARETVAVKGLPKNVNVEISMILAR